MTAKRDRCNSSGRAARLRLECLEERVQPSANLITNGDFELGNVGFGTTYTYVPGNIYDAGTYDVVTNPHLSHPAGASYGDHTTGSGLMFAANGAVNPGRIVWKQIIDVDPNSLYVFSAWVSNWDQNPGHAVAQLDFGFNGTDAGRFNAPTTAGVWQRSRPAGCRSTPTSWPSRSSTRTSRTPGTTSRSTTSRW
jgi:hypothetical protein